MRSLLLRLPRRRRPTSLPRHSRPFASRRMESLTVLRTASATAASTLRPYVWTAVSAASARWFSVLQDTVDNGDTTSTTNALEQLAARVGLDEFTADVLPALKVLAESLHMVSQSGAIQSWTSSDWLLGLTVLAQHNTRSGRIRPPRLADPARPVRREELTRLLRFVRISDAVYAATTEQFCEQASLPSETVVRSFDGGILAPKFVLLKDDAAREIVLAVRGTASLLDFCTDICLMNEPFADGQGHRGIVHAARWLVKNVREDLDQLTTAHADYRLVVTGHSLGAGVAALAAMELRPAFPSLQCIAFATPACVTEPLATTCAAYVTTVVNGDDCVPRFHQHSMDRLQRDVARFDWRSALKRMVDEEIEEHKTLVRQKRDQHLSEIAEAFQRIRRAQEEQAKDTLTHVMRTPVGRRVSASLELTKAAFWTDQPATERLASVKQIAQQQKLSGDDATWWESLEATVAGLETLARAITRRQELQAVLTKSKVLLANTTGVAGKATTGEDQSTTLPNQQVSSAIETAERPPTKTVDFARMRSRLKSVIDQTTQTLQTEAKETIKDISETVTASVSILKNDVEDALERQTIKIEDTVAAIQSEIARGTEALVTQTEQTAESVVQLTKEFAADLPDASVDNQTVVTAVHVETAEPEAAVAKAAMASGSAEELLEPLFPPGRILYLDPLVAQAERSLAAEGEDDNEPSVALLHVANDEFSRVVLSNRMLLDHLCTTYEKMLQDTAARMDQQK